MAHFARIEGNIVQEVIVVANAAIDGGVFPDSEPVGQAMLAESGFTGTYLQCSYSGSFRGAYPGIGWTYDPDNDVFVEPSSSDEPTADGIPSAAWDYDPATDSFTAPEA
jgi:hypothetical protein